jgi:hypothetical protein
MSFDYIRKTYGVPDWVLDVDRFRSRHYRDCYAPAYVSTSKTDSIIFAPLGNVYLEVWVLGADTPEILLHDWDEYPDGKPVRIPLDPSWTWAQAVDNIQAVAALLTKEDMR